MALKPICNAVPVTERPAKRVIPAALERSGDQMAAFAEAYERAGWKPVVLRPNEKRPAFSGWQSMSLSTVVEALRANPAYNLGVAVPEGYFVLDVDTKHGAPGLETLRAWEDQYGPLKGMLVQISAGRGWHYLGRSPANVRLKNAVRIAPGIDIRAAGGLIAVEPSTIDGNSYCWIDYEVLLEAMPEIPIAPEWLIDLCPKHDDATPAVGNENGNMSIPEGQRNDTLFRKGSALRGQGLSELEIRMALQGINARQCQPPLAAGEVVAIAKSAATYPPNPIAAPLNRTQRRVALRLLERTAAKLFIGNPKPVKWLIDRVFPSGKVILLASPPGIGKSYLALELALAVTQPHSPLAAAFCFGGRVRGQGRVVILSAEDDLDELHRRLHAALKGAPMPDNLHIVSLPDEGHFNITEVDSRTGMRPTQSWQALREEISQLDDVALIIVDTLQAVSAGDLNAAEVAQAIMNELNEVASQTGAAIMVLHHLVKGVLAAQNGLLSSQSAMDAIRGSGAIAGSARAAYCLFPHPKGAEICEVLGLPYEENKVVYGLVAKSNSAARREYTIYVRDESGLLRDRTLEYRQRIRGDAELRGEELLQEIAQASQQGRPYAVAAGSANGLHKRRHEMAPQFHDQSASWFGHQAEQLVRAGKLRKVQIKNGYQYLPVIPVDSMHLSQADSSPAADVLPRPTKRAGTAGKSAKQNKRGRRA